MAEVSINVDDLKPNSHAYKQGLSDSKKTIKMEKPKIEPVLKRGARVETKESFASKFFKTFLAEDVADIKEFFIKDCIIPSAKNAILNMLSMGFYGESYDGRGGYSYRGRDRYDYGTRYNYYDRRDRYDRDRRDYGRDQNRRERDRSSDPNDYRNIVLYNKDDAERLVGAMRRRIRETGGVSIAEMYSLMGEPSEYTDTSYGWLDERDVGIRKVSKGYLIDVTEARYLD